MDETKKTKKLHLGLHELLTAALICCNEKVYSKRPFEILQDINAVLEKDIVVNKSELPTIFSESCYTILAQALSAAKFIKANICPGKISKIFLTDRSWPKEIKKFNIEKYGMKRYNSSDLVIKYKRKYIGISLKRKKYETEKDPPFLNKSFRSILSKDPVHSHILDEYNKNENLIFSNIVQNAIKENIILVEEYSGNWKEYISKIDNKYINLCLQNNPIIQKFCSSVFVENPDLRKLLYTLALRNDIKELEHKNFHFYVVLGIGHVKGDHLETLDGKLINKTEEDLKISVRYNGRYSSGIVCYI